MGRSICLGAAGFTAASLAVFGSWAFAGRWFYGNLGEGGAFAVWGLMFIVIAAVALKPLAPPGWSLARFAGVFSAAYFLYAVVWCVCWFALRNKAGEWLGSAAGAAAFTAVVAYAHGISARAARATAAIAVVLFAAHSAGYFLGDLAHTAFTARGVPPPLGLDRRIASAAGKLLWGLCYGVGFGAGMGYVFHALAREDNAGVRR